MRKEKALRYAARKAGILSDYLGVAGPPSEDQIVRRLLRGLSELSEDSECCLRMRKDGLLRLLTVVVKRVSLGLEDNRCISRVLANVSATAFDSKMVEEIARSPLLSLLSSWSNSKDLDLCLRGEELSGLCKRS